MDIGEMTQDEIRAHLARLQAAQTERYNGILEEIYTKIQDLARFKSDHGIKDDTVGLILACMEDHGLEDNAESYWSSSGSSSDC